MTLLYPLNDHNDGCLIYIRLTPNSAHDRIQGIFYDQHQHPYLKISIIAPPVDGKANEALLRFLAKTLKIPFTSLTLIKGHSDRKKTIFVENYKSDDLRKILFP